MIQMQPVTPYLFVGSSTEGLQIAYAIQENLEDDAEVLVWTQDVFRPSEYILESLLHQLDRADVGIFVFSPDDTVRIRGAEYEAARDNVVFELGLFVGRLGRDRSYLVSPRTENLRLPSDLLGIAVLKYDPERRDRNLSAALGPATARIRARLREVEPKATKARDEFDLPVIDRRDLLTGRQRQLLAMIEARPGVSQTELQSVSGDMTLSELYYRLEQLRLLTLVRAHLEPGDRDPRYWLHEAYEAAKRARSIRTHRSE
jgi:hypothetical protein